MSTVIKSGQAGPILKHLSTVDLADHLSEAHAIIAEAKRQAASIVAEAKRERSVALGNARDAGFEAGFRRGHEEGTKAGREAAYPKSLELFEERHSDVVAAMNRAVAEIDEMKAHVRARAEKEFLDFSVSVASKLTFAIGKSFRESALANVSRALELVAARTDLTIKVHPDDLASIETYADSVLKQIGASRAVSVVADDSMAPGGCRILSGPMEVDSTLETQVEQMVSLLVDGWSGDV